MIKLAKTLGILCKAPVPFDVHSRPPGLCRGQRENCRVRIESHHSRSRYAALHHDREGSGAASDIEDRVAMPRADLLDQRLPPAPFASQHAERDIVDWR